MSENDEVDAAELPEVEQPKTRTRRSLFLQILLVTLAFALMVVSSYFFMRDIERAHLERQIEETFTSVNALLSADLKELETMLGLVSENIREMLLRGATLKNVEEYIRDVTVYSHETLHVVGFMNIFAMLDAFDGAMFNPLYEEPGVEFRGDSNFDPTARPWYILATEAGGDIAITDTYADYTSGIVAFTYARALYDDDGQRLATICLDVSLNRLYEYSSAKQMDESSYWTLHDKNNVVIAHPNEQFISLPFRDVDSDVAVFADEIEREGSLSYAMVYNYLGEQSLFSARQLENGWYLGIVTNASRYYSAINTILWFLILLGTLLASVLITILVRINLAKEKSEELARATIKKAAEEKIALHNAQAANKAKSAFLANMSHEIRTPLNAILGIAEIELQSGALPPRVAEGMEKIYESGSMLLGIINDILDLSKIEADKMELVPVSYDLPSLLNDVVSINCLHYANKQIEFIFDVDAATPQSLFGDELRLKQILNNFLSNAFKYTDKGEIRLSVWTEPSVTDDMVTLVFRVQDTGQGMTGEQVSNLFTEYTRFNTEANRTTVGTGLGLSITKHLVEMMNGEIAVDSQYGKGSIFTARIPQKRINGLVCGNELVEKLRTFRFRNVSAQDKNLPRENMPYGSVLVVDDVESNVYVARGMLLPYGLRIDTATSGVEAVDKIRSGNVYDLIFMDHMMPKMDGIEAAKHIRDFGYKKPIVALTANAVKGQAEKFIESGFDGYISKPIDSRELDDLLNEHVRSKAPPEVVQAAQQEPSVDLSEIEEYFIMDAEDAAGVLGEMYAVGNPGLSDEQLDTYEITVHGMKSAFLNVNEPGLSAFARRLEQAAKERDFALMSSMTPVFLSIINALIEKLKSTRSLIS